MEWYQVVKLSSATIPCFFRLLFIERKRQGLILGKKRLDRVVRETKRLRPSADAFECKWMHMMRLHTNLPLFLSSSSPLQPPIIIYLSLYLPSMKQINCFMSPRRNGETTATTTNDNQMFCEIVLSPYNPISPKAIPLASRANRRYEVRTGGWATTILEMEN